MRYLITMEIRDGENVYYGHYINVNDSKAEAKNQANKEAEIDTTPLREFKVESVEPLPMEDYKVLSKYGVI